MEVLFFKLFSRIPKAPLSVEERSFAESQRKILIVIERPTDSFAFSLPRFEASKPTIALKGRPRVHLGSMDRASARDKARRLSGKIEFPRGLLLALSSEGLLTLILPIY